MDLTVAEIAVATDGQLRGGRAETVVRSFTFDTRTLEPGACFVALQGERDGHEFASEAFRRGAVAALVARVPAPRPDAGSTTIDAAWVVVADPLSALAALGRLARGRLAGATVIGITGSAGKTATKDLTAAACAPTLAVHASVGSFNNELGLPLTLLAAPPRTEVVVAEMGARLPGNIADLCAIARPDVGIVTHIGLAHAEHLGGADDIAAVKGELVEALPAAGLAVLNADDEATPLLATRTRARVLRVGTGADADVRTRDVSLDAELRPRFELDSPWGSAAVALGVRGHHQVQNAAMAAAAALSLGVPIESAVQGLAAATTAPWRMQLHADPDGVSVLNDAYNASPTSVAAALESFARLQVVRRRIAVLGEMLELGGLSEEAHRAAGERVADLGIDVLIVVGAGAAPAGAAARCRGVTVIEVVDAGGALATVRAVVRPGDAVLVKGSRAVGLEAVVTGLIGAPADEHEAVGR